MDLLDASLWMGRVFIDGWTPGGAGEVPIIEPASGEDLGRLGMTNAADVARAGGLGSAAQPAWANAGYQDRAAILRKAGALFEAQAEEIQGWIIRETGSVRPKAQLETWFAASACYEAAGLPSAPYGRLLRTRDPVLSMSRRLPLGVIGVIAPFNFPLVLSIRAIAPALALGNSVLLKPDPRTSVSGGVVVARILEEAGIPPGVFSLLPGGADTGEALVVDPNVSMISFTGSARSGRAVGALAAHHLKKCHLELGGNSALIVLEDVDLEKAVPAGAFGSFMHQGQVCMATGRHLVQRSISDDYTSALSRHAEDIRVGNPATDQVELGPLIDAKQRDKVHAIVTESVDRGARLVTGGTFEDLFYRPTVLRDVPVDSRAFREEIFGPVAPIVAFDSIEEAIKLASGTEYGLSLGILTRDVMKGLEIAEQIPAGVVHINDQTVGDEVVNPFGGVKDTGNSWLGGNEANIAAFTQNQWVTMRGDPPAYPF